MVTLNKIYTRTGDGGFTRLADGAERRKTDARVCAYGAVDETNAAIGVARAAHPGADLNERLARIQNELFDVGADLATPAEPGETPGSRLRVSSSQVARLEADIDALNADLEPLTSFVLPAGTPLAAALHMARTVARRAEREVVALVDQGEAVNLEVLRYLNRLSDFLFVAARHANDQGRGDVLWRSGATV